MVWSLDGITCILALVIPSKKKEIDKKIVIARQERSESKDSGKKTENNVSKRLFVEILIILNIKFRVEKLQNKNYYEGLVRECPRTRNTEWNIYREKKCQQSKTGFELLIKISDKNCRLKFLLAY